MVGPELTGANVAQAVDSSRFPSGWRYLVPDGSLLSIFPAAPVPVDLKFGCDAHACLLPARLAGDAPGHLSTFFAIAKHFVAAHRYLPPSAQIT
jgi:hypothetical protein